MQNLSKTNKGVTLIALVVTIVVLIILAGISIIIVLDGNGILEQAKMGANSMVSAETNTQEAFNSLASEILNESDNSESLKPGQVARKTRINNYNDGINMATIPEGFTVSGIESEQKISNGLVIYDIPEEKLSSVNWNEDKDADGNPDVRDKYNQFVWIPIKDKNDYQRNLNYPSYYDSALENTLKDSTFTDINYLPDTIQPEKNDAENNEMAERNAVLKYEGFYIARYECGKESNLAVSKQKANIWMDATQTQSKSICKTMYNDNIVKTALCSGIQWDKVMEFVDRRQDGKGNLFNVRIPSDTRHTNNSNALAGTNDNDKVQNIYDLEGNKREWVAEKNNTTYPFIARSGDYTKNENYKAAVRSSKSDKIYDTHSFRVVLYVM